MTWVKLDDGFPDHPKVLAAGGSAAWLYVCGLCYCGRHMTDGFVPNGALSTLVDPSMKPRLLAAKLVRAGLWAPVDGGWMVHDYARHQRTKAQVEADRESARERQSRKRHGVTHGEVTQPDKRRREENPPTPQLRVVDGHRERFSQGAGWIRESGAS